MGSQLSLKIEFIFRRGGRLSAETFFLIPNQVLLQIHRNYLVRSTDLKQGRQMLSNID